LVVELERLAAKTWRHPVTGEPVRIRRSTIERWLHAARKEKRDPVGVLRRRVRGHAGETRGVSATLGQLIRAHYREHRAEANNSTRITSFQRVGDNGLRADRFHFPGFRGSANECDHFMAALKEERHQASPDCSGTARGKHSHRQRSMGIMSAIRDGRSITRSRRTCHGA
jgi:hypothetical protein